MVKLCQPYTNAQGKTYAGCGQPLKWVNEMPLTQVGEWPGGKPKYAGHYEHYDGSPSRHGDDNPPNQKAYQQTYAPQIEQQDKEQAKIQAAGFTESKYGGMFKEYMDNSIGQINEVAKGLRAVAESIEMKHSSNNINIIGISKSIDDLEKKVEKNTETILKAFEEVAKSFGNQTQKIDAFLAVHSFRGADEMLQPQSNTEDEVAEV